VSNIIAIDLGSNSMSILKYNCQRDERLYATTKTVKTADGLAQTGKISSLAVERVIAAIKELQGEIDFSNSVVKAVTTEAIRSASNGEEILNKIAKETAVLFQVINGETEAKYALLATHKRLELLGFNAKSFVLVDIGGGSTELIFSYNGKRISKSFKVGIVTLTQSYKGVNEIKEAIPKVMQELRDFCTEVYETYGSVELFVATAGTPTTIAAMKLGFTYTTYDSEKIHGVILDENDLQMQFERLLLMSITEREKIVGVGRADLIASGILIFKELYSITNFKESMVIDDGVREGVVYEACASVSN